MSAPAPHPACSPRDCIAAALAHYVLDAAACLPGALPGALPRAARSGHGWCWPDGVRYSFEEEATILREYQHLGRNARLPPMCVCACGCRTLMQEAGARCQACVTSGLARCRPEPRP